MTDDKVGRRAAILWEFMVVRGEHIRRRSGVETSRRFSPTAVLLLIVVVLDVLVVAVGFWLQHYLGYDVTASLTDIAPDTFPAGSDGLCDPSSWGFGVHCFGDYNLVRLFAFFPDPWAQNITGFYSNYPAAGMLVFLVFGAIGELFGDVRVGLGLFLVAMTVGFSLPAIWATKGRPIVSRIAIAAAIGPLSFPALMAIDRGNVVGFAVPILWLLLLGLGRDRRWLVISAIVVATVVKPQYAVLVLLPLLRGRWKDTVIATLLSVGANLLAFLIWPAHFPASVVTAVKAVLQFGSSLSLHAQFPPNISFARGFDSIEIALRQLLGQETDSTYVQRVQSWIGVVILVGTIVLVIILRRRIPIIVSAMLLIVSASLFTSVSYSYYLVYAIPFAAVIFRHPASSGGVGAGLFESARRQPLATTVAGGGIAVATALTLTRILLPPWRPLELGHQSSDGPLVLVDTDWIPVAWFIVIVLVAIAAFRDRHWADDQDRGMSYFGTQRGNQGPAAGDGPV